jgi:iron complex outermembrane receptor protein
MLVAMFSFFAVHSASAVIELEEVVVTATKRTESTQDIALSIETVSGETMEAMGITDFSELQSTVPNLNVGEGITSQAIIIRGLGSGA